MEFALQPNLCLLGMLRRTRQSDCLSEVCGGKEHFYARWKTDKVTSISS